MQKYQHSPWVFTRLPPITDVFDCQDVLRPLTGHIYETLREAEWDVGQIAPRIEISSSLTDPAFSMCTLGISNFPFWSVSLGGKPMLVMDQESFCGPPECCCDLDPGGACGLYLAEFGIDIQNDVILYPYLNLEARAAAIREAVSAVYRGAGAELTWYFADAVEGNFIQRALVRTLDPVTEVLVPFYCPPPLSIGNQLVTSVHQARGGGLIAKARPNPEGLGENKVSLYFDMAAHSDFPNERFRVHYRTRQSWDQFNIVRHPAVNVDPEWIAEGNDPAWLDTFTVDEVGTKHPLDIVFEDLVLPFEDRQVVTLNFTNEFESKDFWACPYACILTPTNAATGGSEHMVCAAIQVKPLEGEDPLDEDTWGIQQAKFFFCLISGGQGIKDVCYLMFSGLGNGAIELKQLNHDPAVYIVTHESGFVWGPLVFNVYGASGGGSVGAFANGVEWVSGNAEIAEPWCGGSYYNPSESGIAPLLGQFPDAIIPSRNIAVGNGTNPIFPWDGQLWRYLQVQKTATPGTSLALRVKDAGIFTGAPKPLPRYNGPELAEIRSVQIKVNPVPRGGTVTFVVTVSGDLISNVVSSPRGVMVYFWFETDARVVALDQILTWSQNDPVTKEFEFSVLNTEYSETARVVFKGTNRATATIIYA